MISLHRRILVEIDEYSMHVYEWQSNREEVESNRKSSNDVDNVCTSNLCRKKIYLSVGIYLLERRCSLFLFPIWIYLSILYGRTRMSERTVTKKERTQEKRARLMHLTPCPSFVDVDLERKRIAMKEGKFSLEWNLFQMFSSLSMLIIMIIIGITAEGMTFDGGISCGGNVGSRCWTCEKSSRIICAIGKSINRLSWIRHNNGWLNIAIFQTSRSFRLNKCNCNRWIIRWRNPYVRLIIFTDELLFGLWKDVGNR